MKTAVLINALTAGINKYRQKGNRKWREWKLVKQNILQEEKMMPDALYTCWEQALLL